MAPGQKEAPVPDARRFFYGFTWASLTRSPWENCGPWPAAVPLTQRVLAAAMFTPA